MISTTTNPPPAPLTHILETCIYVRDIEASARFYQETLNIAPFIESVTPPPSFPSDQTKSPISYNIINDKANSRSHA
jgi:hypothetical protein